MDKKLLTILGVVVAIGGAALSMLGSWVGEKQQDIKIAEKVAEALANATEGES